MNIQRQISKILEKDLFKQIKIGDIPLIYFYKIYLQENILPNPFIDLSKIKEKKNSVKKNYFVKLFSYFFRKYIITNNHIKILISKLKKVKSSKNDLLTLTYTNHISYDNGKIKIFRLQEIMEKIDEDKKLNNLLVVVDPLTNLSLKQILKSDNLIYNYITEDIIKKARKDSKRLYKIWENISFNDKKNACLIKEGDFWLFLKDHINFFYSKDMIYTAIIFIEAFKRIIKTQNIKGGLVTSENGLFEKCLMAAAKESKTEILIVQHGVGLGTIPIEPICKTKFAIMGNAHKKKLLEQGIDSKNIEVVGPVIFEDIHKFIGGKKKKEKNVLIATQPLVEDNYIAKIEYIKRIEIILREINKISGVNVFIKLHPRDKQIKFYKKIIKDNQYNNIEIYEGKLNRNKFYKLIQKSDSFLSFGSTSILEAMIIDRPIVLIKILDKAVLGNWLKKNSLIEIDYNKDVKTAIERSFKDEKTFQIKRKEFIKESCGDIKNASKNIVKILSKIIK